MASVRDTPLYIRQSTDDTLVNKHTLLLLVSDEGLRRISAHTIYPTPHSSEGPRKPKSVSHPRARFSRRLGGTYSGLASRGSSHRTHGSHLRLTEVHPRELENLIHIIWRIPQPIRLTCPPHVSRSFRRPSDPPLQRAKSQHFAPVSCVGCRAVKADAVPCSLRCPRPTPHGVESRSTHDGLRLSGA